MEKKRVSYFVGFGRGLAEGFPLHECEAGNGGGLTVMRFTYLPMAADVAYRRAAVWRRREAGRIKIGWGWLGVVLRRRRDLLLV